MRREKDGSRGAAQVCSSCRACGDGGANRPGWGSPARPSPVDVCSAVGSSQMSRRNGRIQRTHCSDVRSLARSPGATPTQRPFRRQAWPESSCYSRPLRVTSDADASSSLLRTTTTLHTRAARRPVHAALGVGAPPPRCGPFPSTRSTLARGVRRPATAPRVARDVPASVCAPARPAPIQNKRAYGAARRVYIGRRNLPCVRRGRQGAQVLEIRNTDVSRFAGVEGKLEGAAVGAAGPGINLIARRAAHIVWGCHSYESFADGRTWCVGRPREFFSADGEKGLRMLKTMLYEG